MRTTFASCPTFSALNRLSRCISFVVFALLSIAPFTQAQTNRPPGIVVTWGNLVTRIPSIAAGTRFTAIAADEGHTVALKNDGSIVAWGWDHFGQTTAPDGLPPALAIAAGGDFTVALVTLGSTLHPAAASSFVPTSPLAVTRCWHSATLPPNGKVLVAGGVSRRGGEVYDPATGTWTETGALSCYHLNWHRKRNRL